MIPPSDLPEINKVDTTSSSKSSNENVSEKVKALRESIANGTYQVNTKAIAQAIVKSGVLEK